MPEVIEKIPVTVTTLETNDQLRVLMRYIINQEDVKLLNFNDNDSLIKYLRKSNKTLLLIDLNDIPQVDAKKVTVGKLHINLKKMTVKSQGQKLKLTPTEFRILYYLYSKIDYVVSQTELLEHIWGFDGGKSNTIKTHIQSLRKKLGDNKNLIRTVHGFGYILSETSDITDE